MHKSCFVIGQCDDVTSPGKLFRYSTECVLIATCAISILIGIVPIATAHTLVKTGSGQLNFNLSLWTAAFESQHNYDIFGDKKVGKSDWQEYSLGYGLSGYHNLAGGEAYGDAVLKSTGTVGQGDAAGFTDGTERRTALDDFYVGWRSGNDIRVLGSNGVDLSFGRQTVIIGNGFLIDGDVLSFGRPFDNGALNRGGAHWLADRTSFARTVVLRIGGTQGWHGSVMYLGSHNRGQAETRMGVLNLDNTSKYGTLGLSYFHVFGVDDDLEQVLGLNRDHMKIYDARFQGDAGTSDLFLSAEYAYEDKDDQGNQNGWYAEAGWTFSRVIFQPSIKYRFSRFSPAYDPMFYSDGPEGLGTWAQGEIAGIYAGPFNTNSQVNTVFLSANFTRQLAITLSLWRYHTLDEAAGPDTNGQEEDLYVAWSPNQIVTLVPLMGLYKPQASALNGGTQLGGAGTSLYGMLFLMVDY